MQYCPIRRHRRGYLGRFTRRQAGRLALAMTAVLTVSACNSGGPNEHERQASIYAAIIQALAPDTPPDPGAEPEEFDRVVYAGSLRDDEDIPLEVQAAVVEALEDFATVRFIDVRSEAIDDTADGEPVIEDGVLVLLGSVPSGPSPSVEAERYIDRRTDQRFWVRLESSDEEWSIVRMDITRSSAMASRAAWS